MEKEQSTVETTSSSTSCHSEGRCMNTHQFCFTRCCIVRCAIIVVALFVALSIGYCIGASDGRYNERGFRGQHYMMYGGEFRGEDSRYPASYGSGYNMMYRSVNDVPRISVRVIPETSADVDANTN